MKKLNLFLMGLFLVPAFAFAGPEILTCPDPSTVVPVPNTNQWTINPPDLNWVFLDQLNAAPGKVSFNDAALIYDSLGHRAACTYSTNNLIMFNRFNSTGFEGVGNNWQQTRSGVSVCQGPDFTQCLFAQKRE